MADQYGTLSWERLRARYLTSPGPGVLAVRQGRRRVDAWPLSQVAAAAAVRALGQPHGWDEYDALVRIADERHRFRDVGYLAGQRRSLGVKELYNDDNGWLGLVCVGAALARIEDPAGHPADIARDLARARMTLRLVMSQEDRRGGVYWRVGVSARHACATGPGGILALRVLAAATQVGAPPRDRDRILAFALRCSRFLAGLRDDAGMVRDHVQADGAVEPAVYSYNQGTAIGLAVQLYRTTGDPQQLAAAQDYAAAGARHFGPGGRDSALWRDPPAFVSIYLRNLLSLYAVAPDDRWPAVADAWRTAAERWGWDEERGTYTGGGIGRYRGAPALDHAGIAYVHLAREGPVAHYPLLT